MRRWRGWRGAPPPPSLLSAEDVISGDSVRLGFGGEDFVKGMTDRKGSNHGLAGPRLFLSSLSLLLSECAAHRHLSLMIENCSVARTLRRNRGQRSPSPSPCLESYSNERCGDPRGLCVRQRVDMDALACYTEPSCVFLYMYNKTLD